MYLRFPFPPPRLGLGRVDVIVLVNLVLLAALFLLPACQRRMIDNSARTQSTNNLKQIALAAASFHDVNKRLPFNGIRQAVATDPTSGSWAFQILPYIDQAPLFNDLKGEGVTTRGIQAYLCPGRGRPSVEEGKGAWTDYFINNYLNEPENADMPNNHDKKRTMDGISDGTSNTIFAGQGYIRTTDYNKTKDVFGSRNIYAGGTAGTMRGGPKWEKGLTPSVWPQRDSAADPLPEAGNWGGPYPQGALVAFCDATVRMISYRTPPNVFGAYLTPTGNEDVPLPD